MPELSLLTRAFAVLAVCIFSLGTVAFAAETEPLRPPTDFPIPASPPLSPQESLKALKVAPGFHVELVASEPLINTPVAIAFDTDGRIWVCEMRGYMHDVDGNGEDQTTGRIVILEDTDGDGKMDKSTVFLDGLVLPRSLAFANGGVLVAEPPKLWFCGPPGPDGGTTKKTELLSDFSTSGGQPEYQPNGLLWAMDNWIYNARGATRYRFDTAGQIQSEPTISRGQWGITQDDEGRLFYNYNSDQLRCDVTPYGYLSRNPDLRTPAGVNVAMARDQLVFPARVNPGVNRGYEKKVLRPDGTLRTYTACCGPVVYRGGLFPADFNGNAFVCEPAGNLVRRDAITWQNFRPLTQNPYESSEFLSSTEERFRPVNLNNGPDGALYVVDMHRGLLQHKAFLSSYLRDQILSRGLEKPLDQGRIYRVVPNGVKTGPLPRLADGSPAGLVARLGSPNGWWRDTAQRLLVEKNDPAAVPLLTRFAANGKALAAGRLQALWTLHGMGKLEAPLVESCLAASDPGLRAGAIRLGDDFLPRNPQWLARVQQMAGDGDEKVCLQALLSLGNARDAKTTAILQNSLTQLGHNPIVRDAVISGFRGRELETLKSLLADPRWSQSRPGLAESLGVLARCVVEEKNPVRAAVLLKLLAAQSADLSWRRQAILAGLADAANAKERSKSSEAVKLDASPLALFVSTDETNEKERARLERIPDLFDWPGKSRRPTAPDAEPLTTAQHALFDKGKIAFEQTCGACHQPSGLGMEGLAPPLVDSPWVVGSEKRLIRIALHGLAGNVSVNGKSFDMEMPPMGSLSDEDLAGIFTYIRRRWGNSAPAVDPAQVAGVRQETRSRTSSWTVAELQKVP